MFLEDHQGAQTQPSREGVVREGFLQEETHSHRHVPAGCRDAATKHQDGPVPSCLWETVPRCPESTGGCLAKGGGHVPEGSLTLLVMSYTRSAALAPRK